MSSVNSETTDSIGLVSFIKSDQLQGYNFKFEFKYGGTRVNRCKQICAPDVLTATTMRVAEERKRSSLQALLHEEETAAGRTV